MLLSTSATISEKTGRLQVGILATLSQQVKAVNPLQSTQDVIASHLCSECGTCAGICPTQAIEMRETSWGALVPHLDEEKCVSCSLCNDVCPQIQVLPAIRDVVLDSSYGDIRAAYLGTPSDERVAQLGHTSGFGRSLLAWLLRSGRIQGVLCVFDDDMNPLRPKARLVDDPNEILKASRSKYCPVPLNAALQGVEGFAGKIAVVGLSCHLQGLVLAARRKPEIAKRIGLKVGLICDRILSFRGTDYLLKRAHVSPQAVRRFDYKHKESFGWPGDVRIDTRSGHVKYLPTYVRTRVNAVFTPLHCWLCPDKMNVMADVVIGDPWGLCHGKDVPTLVLARTAIGHDIVKEASSLGIHDLQAVPQDEALKGHDLDGRRQRVQFAAEICRRRSCPLPTNVKDLRISDEKAYPRTVGSRLGFWMNLNPTSWLAPWCGRLALLRIHVHTNPASVLGRLLRVFRFGVRTLLRRGR